MNILFDLIGATLIGGVILLLIINLNIYSSQAKFSSDSELQLQRNAKTLAEIINGDLRKIGFNKSGLSIITAEKNKISFYSDIDSNQVVDVVQYTISDSLAVLSTKNPRDKVLYRIVNNDTSRGPSLGLIDLQFSYNNYLGSKTSVLDSIKYIEVEMWVETPEPINNKYSFTYWEMTINPRNL